LKNAPEYRNPEGLYEQKNRLKDLPVSGLKILFSDAQVKHHPLICCWIDPFINAKK